MKVICILFPVVCLAIMLYAFYEAKHSAYGVTPRFYLSVIPYVAFVMAVELFMVSTNEGRNEFLRMIFDTINHESIQILLLDIFLICGIKYFLTGGRNKNK